MSGRTAALRAVGISGSPSSASKSRALVAYALERLADRGAETALIDLATLPAEALLGRRAEARVTAALEAVAGARVVIAGTIRDTHLVRIQVGPRQQAGAHFNTLNVGGDLLSHTLTSAVPSALEGLASGFGMGPGVPPPP